MKANIELNAQGGSMKSKRYYLIALSLMLLGGTGTAGMAAPGTTATMRVTQSASPILLAEAKPADNAKASDSDDDDKDDKKAAKLKRKQEKQAAKDAEEAAKAKKDDSKTAKKDEKAAEKTADKPLEKSKKEEKVVEKTKKDDKATGETVKSKTVVTDKKTEKTAPSGKSKETETTNVSKSKTTDGDESKKEVVEVKSETEMKTEAVPTFAADAALISVLKDLSRSLKDSEQFTKIEDPAQKAIAELAQLALQKALEDPQLSPNRIVETVGKDNAMPPMGTEAWSSSELDLGDKVKAALSVVWAKRENGLVIVTIAGNADKKAPNGKKIGEFVVVLNARSSVESGFDIQSQQNVSFWLGKIASIAVESDCCPPPPPAPTAEGEQPKAVKEVSTDEEAVKKKSLTALPVLLTSRRREYLATLFAVEKHNALVASKLEEENVANRTAEAAKTETKTEVKEESTATSQISDLPPGVEAKTMQEAYERALRAVAMKELMKMSPDQKEKAKAGEDKDKDKDSAGAAKETATGDAGAKAKEPGTTDSQPTQVEGGAPASKPGAAGAPQSATTTAQVATTTPKYSDATSNVDAGNAASHTSQPGQAAGNQQSAQAMTQSSQSSQSSQGQAPQTQTSQAQTAQNQPPQQPARPPQTIAVLPSNGGVVINNGPDNVAAFRAVRQPSVGALMMVPERALAGQSMTISIFDAKRNPEPSVELSLNGSTMITNIDGQVSFTIPEDATPGRSLNVALAARPEVAPTVIDILQPLIVPSEKQNPSIETVTLTGNHNDTLIINGHFFDGIAPNNKIMIDGTVQGRIAAASPVELRVSLPVNLQSGDHVITVGCDGLNSNPGVFATQASQPVAVTTPVDNKKKAKPPHY